MLNYSLSEIDSLGRKAARGAGYSWGMAEEAGKAVRWLTAFGLPGAEALAALLEQTDSNPGVFAPQFTEGKWNSQCKKLCALASGTAISDRSHWLARGDEIVLPQIILPLLVLPQAGRVAEALDIAVAVSWGNNTVVCTPTGIGYLEEPEWNSEMADLSCKKTEAMEITLKPEPVSRAITQDALNQLSQFAQRTYAPATEASRLIGAGAGLNDND